jgi:hypothetical protein
VKGNSDGTGSQAVKEARCGVSEHHRVEAKLVAVKEDSEDGWSGWSVQRCSVVEEGDDLFGQTSSSRRSASGRGLWHRSEATRAHEGNLGGLLRWLADGGWLGGVGVQSKHRGTMGRRTWISPLTGMPTEDKAARAA